MDRTLYFRPKKGLFNLKYEKYRDEFLHKFKLNIIKINNKNYYAENNDMLIAYKPDMIEIFLYNKNINLEKELKDYFYNNMIGSEV